MIRFRRGVNLFFILGCVIKNLHYIGDILVDCHIHVLLMETIWSVLVNSIISFFIRSMNSEIMPRA